MNIRSDIKIVELKFKNAKRNAFLTNINFVCEYKSSVGKMSRKGLTWGILWYDYMSKMIQDGVYDIQCSTYYLYLLLRQCNNVLAILSV